MRPTPSAIFLSTASDAGYGLLALLGLGHMTHDWGFGLVGLLLSLMLINMGLARSTTTIFLDSSGRAVRQVESVPARDRVMPIVTFLAMTALGVHWVFVDAAVPSWLGWISTACAVISIGAIALARSRGEQLTSGRRLYRLVDHLLFAWLSGSLFYLMLAGFFRGDVDWALWNALIAIVATWGLTLAGWRLADRVRGPSTPDRHQPGYAEIELPGAEGNDPSRAFGVELLRRYGERLRGMAVTLGGVFPLVLCAIAMAIDADTLTGLLAGLAALFAYPGVLIRRWLTFDETTPTQTVTYDRRD